MSTFSLRLRHFHLLSSHTSPGTMQWLWLSAAVLAVAHAQTCVSLQGSQMCRAFASNYINPQNLSRAWPFFENVYDVSSFDSQFSQYLSSSGQFQRTKIQNELQCYGSNPGLTLQYAQTFLCGEFTGKSPVSARSDHGAHGNCRNNILSAMQPERQLVGHDLPIDVLRILQLRNEARQ